MANSKGIQCHFNKHFVLHFLIWAFKTFENNSLSVKETWKKKKKEQNKSWAVVAHAFNPSTWEAGGFLSSRPAWSTKWVPGQPGTHYIEFYIVKHCLKTKTKTNKQTKNKTKNKNKKRICRCGLAGWGVSLGVGSEVSKSHTNSN